ncbi:hypothetical protein BDV97DRAFT_304004 [Delphinella strobiligena]|nr:hypothetical protein BDV97DRAFT_304004 [Delphinella strobiligena]
MSYEDSLSSQYLTSSISSLSSARSQSSWIARTYRQAAQLFLTRRLYEALTTIEPVISLASQDGGLGQDGEQEQQEQVDGRSFAPIATASRTTRVKVWSFYLTLLNSIIELGPEEGKLVFGSTKWRGLAAKAREGSVWDEVVRVGYAEDEGAVDGEVVVNLAALLLAHMVSQRLNQQRLETYLSASSNPTYDVTAHMESSQNTLKNSTRSNHAGGTSTPRDLNTRLKLLELYTLHVLPQNGEWDYARDFISMSEVLDEERREAFVHALQTLQEEKDHDAIREKELRRRQEEEMQQRREDEEKRRRDEARQQEERRQRETDEKHRQPTSRNPASRDRGPSAASSGGRPQPHATTQAKKQQNPRGKAPSKRPPPTPPPSIYRRTTSIMQLMQTTLLNMRQSVVKNPMVLLRFILFLLAFAMAFGRRDVRERVKRSLHHTWDKVRRTVGMGVKVSYI